MPEALWRPFEVESVRSRAVIETELGAVARPPPRFIAVAGLMGSGKTTLARKIAASLGYSYLPSSVTAKDYLSDLNSNPRRWAFETQLAFFCHKAIQVNEALSRSERIILDRTLTEDIHVFAKYFVSKGHIEKRAFDTYLELASFFFKTLPAPDIVIYCECAPSTAIRRIQKRRRDDQFLHSPQHIKSIAKLYEDWTTSYQDSTLLALDGNRFDWREQVIAETVCREIENVWLGIEEPAQQLTLFEKLESSSPKQKRHDLRNSLSLLRPIYVKPSEGTSPYGMASVQPPSTSAYPTAYIAAPFTAKANAQSRSRQYNMIFSSAPHGKISRGKYRSSLLGIETALKKLGIATLLPHRDVNKWGNLSLTPNEVMRLCTEHVSKSDVMVAVLGTSHGSHYEFGLARGMGKPCIVISSDEVHSSFIGSGLDNSDDRVLLLKCKHLSEVPGLLLEQNSQRFLQRFLLI
nr:deoxynucleoside kinase [Hyalangium minutum]